MKVNNCANKSFVIAVLVFSLQGLAQSSESGQPTEKPLEFLYEIVIDPNKKPKLSRLAVTGYRGSLGVTSTSWNAYSTRLAVGIAIRPDDGDFAPSGGIVQFFDMIAKPPELLFTLTDAKDFVRSVAFNPKGTRLAVGGDDGRVIIYDGRYPDSPLKILTHAKFSVQSVVYSPDGNRLAVGGTNGEVIIYDGRNPDSPLHILTDGPGYVQSIVYSPDGNWLAVGGNSRWVNVYDGRNPDLPLHTLSVDASYSLCGLVLSLTYNSDSTRLAAGGRDGAWIFDVENPDSPPDLLKYEGGILDSIVYNPRSNRLATGESQVRVEDDVWDWRIAFYSWLTRQASPAQTLTGAMGRVLSVSYNHDGSQLAAGGMDGKVRIYSDPK